VWQIRSVYVQYLLFYRRYNVKPRYMPIRKWPLRNAHALCQWPVSRGPATTGNLETLTPICLFTIQSIYPHDQCRIAVNSVINCRRLRTRLGRCVGGDFCQTRVLLDEIKGFTKGFIDMRRLVVVTHCTWMIRHLYDPLMIFSLVSLVAYSLYNFQGLRWWLRVVYSVASPL